MLTELSCTRQPLVYAFGLAPLSRVPPDMLASVVDRSRARASETAQTPAPGSVKSRE